MNDVRGPGLPLLMAACIALLIGGVFAVTWWRQPSPANLRDRTVPPPQPPAADPGGIRSNSPRLVVPLRSDRDDRVDELRRELARARAQVTQLEDFRIRYRDRFPEEAELDWSAALDTASRQARALLSGDAAAPAEPEGSPMRPAAAGPAGPGEDGGSPAPSSDLATQIRDLERRLEVALYLDEQQGLEIEQLRADQLEMSRKLAAETESSEELARLLETERYLLTGASRALIGLGAAAVPRLVEALAAEDAATREWAANVLGAMGAAAAIALPDLRDARSDSDPAVRTAIRRAIDAIEQADVP